MPDLTAGHRAVGVHVKPELVPELVLDEVIQVRLFPVPGAHPENSHTLGEIRGIEQTGQAYGTAEQRFELAEARDVMVSGCLGLGFMERRGPDRRFLCRVLVELGPVQLERGRDAALALPYRLAHRPGLD